MTSNPHNSTKGVLGRYWNAASCLITVTDGVDAYGFRYDGDGNRLTGISNGAFTRFRLMWVWPYRKCSWSKAAEGQPRIFICPTLSPQTTDGVELQCGGPFTSVAGCCANGLGSVRQELDSSEDVDAVNSYRPFGLPLDGSGGDPYGFAGEPWESNVRLLYLRARYYNPYLNRFISPDTIVPDYAFPPSIHKYAYVHNNPVNFTDPSGHQAELPLTKKSKRC